MIALLLPVNMDIEGLASTGPVSIPDIDLINAS
jgi:hypothetical protein